MDIDRIGAEPPSAEQLAGDRHIFPCGCGMWRSLPGGIRIGEVCELVPCPRCGSAARYRFKGASVEMVPNDTPLTIVQGIRVDGPGGPSLPASDKPQEA